MDSENEDEGIFCPRRKGVCLKSQEEEEELSPRHRAGGGEGAKKNRLQFPFSYSIFFVRKELIT